MERPEESRPVGAMVYISQKKLLQALQDAAALAEIMGRTELAQSLREWTDRLVLDLKAQDAPSPCYPTEIWLG